MGAGSQAVTDQAIDLRRNPPESVEAWPQRPHDVLTSCDAGQANRDILDHAVLAYAKFTYSYRAKALARLE
ncbi:hypothetical protein XM38_022980 [Halomicronema hongdechloris C2206]|uniref:Uncharacterized protein n=1 Tax=Halomicronema hongdechloris C2206 TaxID=1641165 RepID=A0A1Z3HM39_9CYAN|nr:hypothetical protein [Halomicronema hongdechloris]ASC71346.1 hypothetical protein XM38_022980 [Halomicronema hongdechloris C2206]